MKYAVVREEQSSGTGGGNASSLAWTTRVLNTIAFDPFSIVSSLASNAFTLASGTYVLRALSPLYATQQSRVRLFNQTDSSVVALGVSMSDQNVTNMSSMTAVSGIVTLSASKAIRLDYWATNAQAGGLGLATTTGAVEVYSQVEIFKL